MSDCISLPTETFTALLTASKAVTKILGDCARAGKRPTVAQLNVLMEIASSAALNAERRAMVVECSRS